MDCLANSQNDICFAKKEMEYLIARSRRAIEEYEQSSGENSNNGSTGPSPIGSPNPKNFR
jgi:hypothetical protein